MKQFINYFNFIWLLLITILAIAEPENNNVDISSNNKSLADTSFIELYNDWFGSDAPPMSQSEYESMICIASATSVGAMITIVGGTAIVVAGTVGSATGTAIALPVLISSMWSACSLGKAVIPGAIWLQNRSKMLVNRIGNAVNDKLPAIRLKSKDDQQILP